MITEKQYNDLLSQLDQRDLTDDELDAIDEFNASMLTQDGYNDLLSQLDQRDLTDDELDAIDRFSQQHEQLDVQQHAYDETTGKLPEMAEMGIGDFTEGLDGNVATDITTTMAALTTTDPQEMADILKQEYGPNLGISYAKIPGSEQLQINATNNVTGKTVTLNRPGLSPTDVIQTLGLATMFTPAGLAKSAGARMALTAGTSLAAQGGQTAVGGSFDPEDVALEVMGGALGEGLGHLAKAGVKKLGDIKLSRINGLSPSRQQSIDIGNSMTQSPFDLPTPVGKIVTDVMAGVKPIDVAAGVVMDTVMGAPVLSSLNVANAISKQLKNAKIPKAIKNHINKLIKDKGPDADVGSYLKTLSEKHRDVIEPILTQNSDKISKSITKSQIDKLIKDPTLQLTTPSTLEMAKLSGKTVREIEETSLINRIGKSNPDLHADIIKKNDQLMSKVKKDRKFVDVMSNIDDSIDNTTSIVTPILPAISTQMNQ